MVGTPSANTQFQTECNDLISTHYMSRSQSTPEEKAIPLPYLLLAIAAGALLLLLCLGFLLFTWQQNQARPLKPARPSSTPAPLLISREPENVTFSQLNEDPIAYIGRLVQVSGNPILLTLPTCSPYSGPTIRWGLVGEELQLNGRGYEQIMRQVSPDAFLTLKGIWRLYDGPLGCGKGAPSGLVWYLDVTQIVAPNPLPLRDGSLLNIPVQPADPLATLAPAPTHDPSQPTATPTLPTPAGTPSSSATPTVAVGVPGTATPTATPDPNRTNTPTPANTPTPTATNTPNGLTPNTPTPTVSPTPTPTITNGGQPPPPPPATATPGSYGGPPAPPPNTPVPTPYD